LPDHSSLKSIGTGIGGDGKAVPQAFTVSGTDFLKDKTLFEEHFGPVAIHVVADDVAQLLEIAEQIPGTVNYQHLG
jgi:acyl-CoA reductase-like NAD-dependent aldehyde dehydrogenase